MEKKVTKRKTKTKKVSSISKGRKKVAKYFYGLGRRKTAVATIRLFEGKGEDTINGKKAADAYRSLREQGVLYSPFEITETKGEYYFSAKASGGGMTGQLDAIKLAIARALIKTDEGLRKILKPAGFLTVDSRIKERKKPGLKKARKREQYSKR